ncbi:unnamed protein product [Pseudo-nitzschia multistriata]|uniref:Uncharacterized protein n=1 Tax=Pseudo-nitzschia multistriata TaxID=183589 RepID=A0A448Z1J2_9STRA|nr:unnamed protein product [Pseudo-nitzschia multistriata]
MPSTAAFLRGAGALLVVHAAYSCMHFRSLLQDLDLLAGAGAAAPPDQKTEEASAVAGAAAAAMIPPPDVVFELALALCLLLAGELLGMGPLQPIELSAGGRRRPLVAPAHRTRDFDVYSNRSKMLLRKAE